MRSTVIRAAIAIAITLLATSIPSALAGGGCHGDSTPPSAGTAPVIKIDGCVYVPTITRVRVGEQVTWLNTSLTAHDVTGTQGAWGSRLLDVGQSHSQAFPQAGLYPYSCSLHPGMAGVIEVVLAAADGPPPSATPDPAAGAGADTGADAGAGSGDFAPLAAGGFGLAVGAGLVALLSRRRKAIGS